MTEELRADDTKMLRMGRRGYIGDGLAYRAGIY